MLESSIQATVGGVSLTGLGLFVNNMYVSEPKAITYMKDVPGRVGPIDLTECYGPVRFETRTMTIEAFHVGTLQERLALRRSLESSVQGKLVDTEVGILPGYYVHGRVQVTYTEPMDGVTVYKIEIEMNPPYMLKGSSTFRANCAGGVWLAFMCGDMPSKPTFDTEYDTLVVWKGTTYVLHPGSWSIDGVTFEHGRNEMYINTYLEPGTTTWGDLEGLTWAQMGSRMVSEIYWMGSPPQSRLTYEQLQGLTWEQIGSKSVQELYFSGTSSVDHEAYVSYEIGDF